MKRFSLTLFVCIYCSALSVRAQQTGTLPSVEDNKSEDNTKFTPITKNLPKFSIGLGVLSPSYSQKFGDDGKIKLDYNQENGVYSYSINNLAHPMSKSTDRSGSDDKKYSTDTMKAADANTHQLAPSSQYNPTSYSLSTGSRPDFPSVGIGYPQTHVSVYQRQGSQVGPPVPQSYGTSYAPNYGSYGPNYGPSYGPPAYPPMPYQSYPNPNSGQSYPYAQSGAYTPSQIPPVPSNMQSSPSQIQSYSPAPVASAPPPQAYAPPAPQPQPVAQYNPYMTQMPSPYGYGQTMSPYSMYGQQSAPQASPYAQYGSPYGGGGYGMYGSPSQQSASTYPYGGGSSDPLANLSPDALNTLRQLYGASSTTSMSYMSPYGGGMGSGMGSMGGGMSSYGSGSGYGGLGSYGSSGMSSGGGLSSLISLFG